MQPWPGSLALGVASSTAMRFPAWPRRAAVPQHSPGTAAQQPTLFQQPLPETTVNTKSSSSRLLGLYATTIVCAVASCLTAVLRGRRQQRLPQRCREIRRSQPVDPEVSLRFTDRINNPHATFASLMTSEAAASIRQEAPILAFASYSGCSDKVGHPALLAIYNASTPQPRPITVASAKTR